MNTPFSAVWRERRISPLLLFARCALCRSSRRRLFDRLRYRLHTDKLDGVAVCQNALLDLELRQGCQEFVQALGAEVAHVKVRVALDELVTDAGGAHPARAVVHFINKAVDDAANGIAVDGRVVPGVGAGGGLGGGGGGRGVVGLAVVEDQIQVFELVARLDEGAERFALAHTDDEFSGLTQTGGRVKSLSDETMQKPSRLPP